ncbi:MAG: carboxymuconolactone decarboxylase family protein [Microthrixaceae bacterium]
MTRTARVAPGERAQVGFINAAIAAGLGRAAGTEAPNLFLTLGRHRRLFRGWLHFAGTLMPGGRLSRRETEMVILRVAHGRRCDYELAHHRHLGARAGLTTGDIGLLGTDEAAEDPRWSRSERDLLRAVDQLLDTHDVDDECWDALRRSYDERQLIELVMLVGHYEMLATAITTLGIEADRPRRRRRG